MWYNEQTMYKYEGIFKPYNPEEDQSAKTEETPIYARPGRLNPDRNIPITRQDRVDVNVHYDDQKRTFVKDSDSPEFTERSANAMNPFEDTALLKGEVKPRSTGVKTGAAIFETKIFVPETNTEEVRKKVKETIREPVVQPVYIADEDAAASSDDIASAMSGVETVAVAAEPQKSGFSIVDVSRLKMYVYLISIFIVLEVLGIALLLFL